MKYLKYLSNAKPVKVARRMGKSASKATVAAEVWRRLFDFIVSTSAQRTEVLSRYRLTPNDSRALFALDSGGRTMQSLATEWGCDPSNATFIVDRLEERGLAERRAHDADRRVKLVALTAAGVKTRASLTRDLYRPPPELLALERADLDRLLRAASKLRAQSHPGLRRVSDLQRRRQRASGV